MVSSALEQLLIMHADHEQNLSTATVRNAGSGQANLYACISAGMSALWGPLHGGANESVIKTLERIAADGGDVAKWVGKAKDPEDRFKLPGFGHPVYRNFDPRAKLRPTSRCARRSASAGEWKMNFYDFNITWAGWSDWRRSAG